MANRWEHHRLATISSCTKWSSHSIDVFGAVNFARWFSESDTNGCVFNARSNLRWAILFMYFPSQTTLDPCLAPWCHNETLEGIQCTILSYQIHCHRSCIHIRIDTYTPLDRLITGGGLPASMWPVINYLRVLQAPMPCVDRRLLEHQATVVPTGLTFMTDVHVLCSMGVGAQQLVRSWKWVCRRSRVPEVCNSCAKYSMHIYSCNCYDI